MTSIWYRLSAVIVLLIVWVGFVGPFCVSSYNDILPVVWIIVSILVLPLLVRFIIKTFKKESK